MEEIVVKDKTSSWNNLKNVKFHIIIRRNNFHQLQIQAKVTTMCTKSSEIILVKKQSPKSSKAATTVTTTTATCTTSLKHPMEWLPKLSKSAITATITAMEASALYTVESSVIFDLSQRVAQWS